MRSVFQRIRAHLGEDLRTAGALLAPPLCEACGERADAPICRACRSELHPIGLRRDHATGLTHLAGAAYAGPRARAIVHRFKYAGARHLAPSLAALVAVAWRAEGLPTAGVTLVPVPLSPERLRERGYDQALLLASALADALALPVCELARRVRPTRSQTGLDPRARAANVAGAFAATGATPRGEIALIDDVWTTGATLEGCRGALVAAGHRVTLAVTAFWTPAL